MLLVGAEIFRATWAVVRYKHWRESYSHYPWNVKRYSGTAGISCLPVFPLLIRICLCVRERGGRVRKCVHLLLALIAQSWELEQRIWLYSHIQILATLFSTTVQPPNNGHSWMGPAILSFIERLSSLRRLKCTSIIEIAPQNVSYCVLYSEWT